MPGLHCKCHHCILNNSIISVFIPIAINFYIYIYIPLSSLLWHWRKQKTLSKHVCKETESCRLCVENINVSATQSSIWKNMDNLIAFFLGFLSAYKNIIKKTVHDACSAAQGKEDRWSKRYGRIVILQRNK